MFICIVHISDENACSTVTAAHVLGMLCAVTEPLTSTVEPKEHIVLSKRLHYSV